MKNFGFKVVADIDDRSCAIEKEVDYEKSHNMFFPEHDSLTLDIEIRNYTYTLSYENNIVVWIRR